MMPVMHNQGHLGAGCALRLYVIMHFTSNLAFQSCTAKPLPGDLTHGLFYSTVELVLVLEDEANEGETIELSTHFSTAVL